MLDELFTNGIITSSLLAIAVIVVLVFIFRDKHNGRKLPPGPTGLPLVGYLPFMTLKPYIKLQELSKKYGPVYSLRFGSENVVILCDYQSMKEAFSKDAVIGRPPDSSFNLNKETIELGAIHHLPWKEQRRFSLHLLRDLGLGKSRMEAHIKEEIEELLERVVEEKGKPISLSKFLAPSTSNNISSLVFGKRRKFDDPKRVILDARLKEIGLLFRKVAWLLFFPLLMAVTRFLHIGKQHELTRALDSVRDYVREEIKEHQESLDPNNIRDFIDGYLLEIEKTKHDPKSSFKVPVLEDLIGAFFGAGSETVRVTVDWLLLIAAAYPEVQKKIQHEIDEVIGRERFPSRSDYHKMPFTEAVILETLRWRAFLAINLPRYTIEDTELNSFFIPKHTQVIAVTWAVHHDPKLWGEDVGDFKPERFLSEDGKDIRKPEYFIPFSTGKRSCPGESLAYVEIFMYFVAILQKFRVHLPDGEVPDLEPVLGITLQPKPYDLCLELRS